MTILLKLALGLPTLSALHVSPTILPKIYIPSLLYINAMLLHHCSIHRGGLERGTVIPRSSRTQRNDAAEPTDRTTPAATFAGAR